MQITGVSSVRYSEDGTGPVAVFRAFDEGVHTIRWSVSGRDDGLFAIDGGVLAFREPPTTRTRSPRQVERACRTGTCTG